jgi:hypothetical protein
MRSESSFEIDGDLIVIDAIVAGPTGHDRAKLVLDTGSALTTLVPEIAEAIGYTVANRVARSVVRTAVAEERSYIVCVLQFTAIGFAVPEIRPAERRILVERIAP